MNRLRSATRFRTMASILFAGLLIGACAENPSVEAREAAFDRSVAQISSDLGAPPQEAAQAYGIEWTKSMWATELYSPLKEGCFWTRHASWTGEVVDLPSVIDALSSIVKTETKWKTWDVEGPGWKEVTDSTTKLAAVGLTQWFYFAVSDQSIDLYVFRKC